MVTHRATRGWCVVRVLLQAPTSIEQQSSCSHGRPLNILILGVGLSKQTSAILRLKEQRSNEVHSNRQLSVTTHPPQRNVGLLG